MREYLVVEKNEALGYPIYRFSYFKKKDEAKLKFDQIVYKDLINADSNNPLSEEDLEVLNFTTVTGDVELLDCVGYNLLTIGLLEIKKEN